MKCGVIKMKGNEALLRIEKNTAVYYLGLYELEDYIQDLEAVRKDLELLEELRKHIVLDITESKISGKNVIVIKNEFDDINVDCTLIFVNDETKEILKRFNKDD